MSDYNLTDALDGADATSSLHRTRQADSRIPNCVPSLNRKEDWGIDTAVAGLEDELMFHFLTTPALRDAMTRDSDRFVEKADEVASSWAGSAQLSDRLKQALGAE
jgi:hypothetical protein